MMPSVVRCRPPYPALHARRLALPVIGRRRENRIAGRRLRRAVERVGGGAPHRVLRRRPMRLQCLPVAIELAEVVEVAVLLILQHVAADTVALVPPGAARIELER